MQNLAHRKLSSSLTFLAIKDLVIDHVTCHVTISFLKKSPIWGIGDGFQNKIEKKAFLMQINSSFPAPHILNDRP